MTVIAVMDATGFAFEDTSNSERSAENQLQVLFISAAFLILSPSAFGQTFDERFDDWPQETRINGSVLVATDLRDPGLLSHQLEELDSTLPCLVLADTSARLETLADLLTGAGFESVSSQLISHQTPAHGLAAQLLEHRVVCCATGPEAERVFDSQRWRDAVAEFLRRGRTLAFAGHPLSHARNETEGVPHGIVRCGIPDAFIASGATKVEQLAEWLVHRPRSFGIRMEPDTVLILEGRRIRVVGNGTATFVVPSSASRPVRRRTIYPKSSTARRTEDLVADLTQWRRAAIERTLDPFPPPTPRSPSLPNGTLVMVGGGRTPEAVMKAFLQSAGGLRNAKLVYIPCRESSDISGPFSVVEQWKRMGVDSVQWRHTKDRSQANSDDRFLEPLKTATGIWFGGGRQWNLSDSYYGTQAHRLMKDVLLRGGVVGGSSAGASIQARYLARASPLENRSIMAPEYERGGFGFLDGVAIDQHFSQRQRQPDMRMLVNRHPQLLGIGIDEETALIVQENAGVVVGNGNVWFLHVQPQGSEEQLSCLSLPEGSRYDLVDRRVLTDTRKDAHAVPSTNHQ